MNRLYWSVRRELWEHRSLYVAPLAAAAVFFVGFVFSTIGMPGRRRAVLQMNPGQQQAAIGQPYEFAALLIMFITTVVGVFYCQDSLYGERRDRSALFWKSMPVSDRTTVLSKASIPMAVLPLVTFGVTVALHVLMLLWSSLILLPSGLAATTWSAFRLVPESGMLLYHLVAVHALWWAPLWGYLLLASAWARRAPFLWAAVPLLTIGIVEKITFNTLHFADLLKHRFLGGPESAAHGGMGMGALTPATPAEFLASPGLWLGLGFFALCLVGAMRLRRFREPT
jgi:ABC-2 type transport system permease protein